MLYGTLNTDCLISLDGRVCLFDDTICHIIDDTICHIWRICQHYPRYRCRCVVLPLPFKIQVIHSMGGLHMWWYCT